MTQLSIIIITLNAERTLAQVLEKAIFVSDDIVVIDSGSSDKTKSIAQSFDVSFYQKEWGGFGAQKNFGNLKAKYDWILSVDADEVLSTKLSVELSNLVLTNEKAVYSIPFINNYCGKYIKYGRWKNERHVRLFNRKQVSWNENQVHEGLIFPKNRVIDLKGHITHFSMASSMEHLLKAKRYAEMGALKLQQQGKKASFHKLYLNPIYRFVKDYFFSLGFLDGKLGFQIARIISLETYWKYKRLKELGS